MLKALLCEDKAKAGPHFRHAEEEEGKEGKEGEEGGRWVRLDEVDAASGRFWPEGPWSTAEEEVGLFGRKGPVGGRRGDSYSARCCREG